MKKFFVLFLMIFLLVGCGKKEDSISLQYDSLYYEISSFENESYALRSYDKSEVEKQLMDISRKYFKTNNSVYQAGKYLSLNEMKELLSKEKLNKIEPVTWKDTTINPSYISAIYEQDYLATNGNLKGISLAIVLDKKQSYEQDGKTLYKIMEESDVLRVGQEKAKELLQYMRTKEELKDIKILIALYMESNTYVKGGVESIGISENETISFSLIHNHYELLDSNYVMNHDMKTYNNFLALKNQLNQSDLYIQAMGLYQGNTLQNIQITIQGNYISQSEILSFSPILRTNVETFPDITVKIKINSNQQTKAFFIKKENSNQLEMYLLEG